MYMVPVRCEEDLYRRSQWLCVCVLCGGASSAECIHIMCGVFVRGKIYLRLFFVHGIEKIWE